MSENLLNDIFGGEDSDIGELSEKELKVEFDSEDEPGKARRRGRGGTVCGRMEAEKDIDGILSRLKPVRPKKADLQSEVEIDEMINALMESMRAAANNDQEFNKAGMPAIAKLKLLPSVKVELSKTLWFPQILEANVLECVKFWLEPLGDGSLPSLDIQKAMFDTLTQLPIETHHLRASLVGRVVMFYTKSERVSPPIKRIAEELISKWMRPILGKSADHKHKVLLEARYEPKNKVIKKSNLPVGDFERENRASIPTKIAPAFSIAPVSYVGSSAGGDKKQDKYRKLKSTMQRMSRK